MAARALGVVCEYNPFHNGHAYHLRQAREQSGCDWVICAMSGSFTQRGALALIGPRERARAALMNGADIVFELPALFAVRNAHAFAKGGVALLDKLNVCDAISFGCEDIDTLASAAASNECDPDVLRTLRDGLDRGESWARARGLPNLPNVILGVEYMRAIQERGSSMRPLPIPRAPERVSAADGVISARRIREMLSVGESVEPYMPRSAYDILMGSTSSHRREDGLDALLLGALRSMPAESIGEAADISEGMERRIKACAAKAVSRADLIERVKCKRYPYARISRALTQAMLGITKSLAARVPEPAFARLIGFRDAARPLLREIRRGADISIIDRPAAYRKHDDPAFALDLRADAIASIACASVDDRRGDHMLTDGIVIVGG
ncbi:MAG: nucleotidyltransferase family protein [Oscillospiraceae bacterium]|jgi:predicted nucleotidyltransferase|nr:nucleotidyltransferase family protein [Oscillospiraceae bacterium]